MTSFDDLLSQVPIGQIAEKLGVDQATATNAVKAALPALLGGLQANANKPEGAASLVDSLEGHGDLVDGGVDIDQVDTKAGAQIVDNVFGEEKNTVISALGNTEGAGGNDLIAKVMPMLAPIVLAFLAKQMGGGGQGGGQASGGAIGDILGNLLGGSSKSGGLGGALGEALAKNAGGALGNVLGGLFGKK
ncbi:DUF937 domain-containing protein [Nocardia arthritidis]|uniref:DUF937 domain-containing protein n=1 Tax=Nocardia arthritidis TaxID=228602 RepID=A0A6G9Y5R9_9NOCA|nr:DUF937 domain-containing protein [Nocardia arthritidis]QIS08588.1 DUF937 domain-containing protein [Nocardia arthritidis]